MKRFNIHVNFFIIYIYTFAGTKVIVLKLEFVSNTFSQKKSYLPPFRRLTPMEESNPRITNLNYGKGHFTLKTGLVGPTAKNNSLLYIEHLKSYFVCGNGNFVTEKLRAKFWMFLLFLDLTQTVNSLHNFIARVLDKLGNRKTSGPSQHYISFSLFPIRKKTVYIFIVIFRFGWVTGTKQ